MDSLQPWIGLTILAVIIGQFAVIIYLHAKHGDQLDVLANALVQAIENAQENPKALDLVEAALTKAVPADLLKQFTGIVDEGSELVKQLTPDQYDELVERVRQFLNEISDGKPNEDTDTPFSSSS